MKIELTYSEQQVLRRAFERWGDQKQIGMAMEECAETITALNHFERGRVSINKVVEEFADAFVCVSQVLHTKGDKSLLNLESAVAAALGKLLAKLDRDDQTYVEGREPAPTGGTGND